MIIKDETRECVWAVRELDLLVDEALLTLTQWMTEGHCCDVDISHVRIIKLQLQPTELILHLAHIIIIITTVMIVMVTISLSSSLWWEYQQRQWVCESSTLSSVVYEQCWWEADISQDCAQTSLTIHSSNKHETSVSVSETDRKIAQSNTGSRQSL